MITIGEPDDNVGPLLTSRKAAANVNAGDDMTPSRGMARPIAVDATAAGAAAASDTDGTEGEDSEVLNAKAVSVVTRVESKLTGICLSIYDFSVSICTNGNDDE
jgi:hypothetical protein